VVLGGYLHQKVVQRLSIASRANILFGGTNPHKWGANEFQSALSLCVQPVALYLFRSPKENVKRAQSPLFKMIHSRRPTGVVAACYLLPNISEKTLFSIPI